MLDKTKRYLVVGLGLLGGKYALELTKAGFHVDGINRSEGHLQYALDHGYIASGKTHDFEDLVQQADHIIWPVPYGPAEMVHSLRPAPQARLHLHGCVRRQDRPCGAGAGHVPGRGGVHCQPPHGRP